MYKIRSHMHTHYMSCTLFLSFLTEWLVVYTSPLGKSPKF